jgi:small-conductance mechanosensitive channel
VLIALREPLGHYGARYFANLYTPFKVGDTIEVRGFSGKVIGINAMTTILLSPKDQLISVPNEMIVREIVVNTSPQAWKEVAIPISLAASVDLAAFESELLKSLSKLRIRLDPQFPPVLTTKSRTPQSAELLLTLMLRRPEDRDSLTREANKRLAELLKTGGGARPRPAPAPAPGPTS